MESLLSVLKELISSLSGKVQSDGANHFQLVLFSVLTSVLWFAIGVMSGGVLAFFVLLLTPAGPGRGYPAYYCFYGTIIVVTTFGIYNAVKGYLRKVKNVD